MNFIDDPEFISIKFMFSQKHKNCNRVTYIVTFSAVLVQICAVLDSGAVSRLCNRAITSAAILLATWPLINGLMGSDLLMVNNHSKRNVLLHVLITYINATKTNT